MINLKENLENQKMYLNSEFNRKKSQIKKREKDITKQRILINEEKLCRNIQLEKILLRKLNYLYNKEDENEKFLNKNLVEKIIFLSLEINKICMKKWLIKKDLLKDDVFKIENLHFDEMKKEMKRKSSDIYLENFQKINTKS